MNILNIHIYQGLQNAVRPSGESNAVLSERSISNVTSSSSANFSGETGNVPGQSRGIIARIDGLQRHVEADLNIVRDPPFFPIATYQRADLVKQVRVIKEQVQRLAPDENEESAFSAGQLKDQATDEELAAALDKLFAFRDGLKSNRPIASPAKIKPGSLLAVEV